MLFGRVETLEVGNSKPTNAFFAAVGAEEDVSPLKPAKGLFAGGGIGADALVNPWKVANGLDDTSAGVLLLGAGIARLKEINMKRLCRYVELSSLTSLSQFSVLLFHLGKLFEKYQGLQPLHC